MATSLPAIRERLVPWARQLGALVDEASGYASLGRWRSAVESGTAEFESARIQMSEARVAYDRLVARRASAQVEVNAMLQKKDRWGNHDLDRFAELCKEEHALSLEEKAGKKTMMAMEQKAEETLNNMMNALRRRFHEEALWSEKVRAASTWGSWSLAGVNIVLFASSILIWEPRRRARLQRELLGQLEDRRILETQAEQERVESISSVVKEETEALGEQLLNAIHRIDSGLDARDAAVKFPRTVVEATEEGTLVEGWTRVLSRGLTTELGVGATVGAAVAFAISGAAYLAFNVLGTP